MPDTRNKSSSSDGFIGLLVLGGILAAIWFWIIPDKFRYSMEFDVPMEKVYVLDKPHDCEWDKAPIGNKYCHFDRHVELVKNDSGAVTSVYISWEKVQE